MTTNKLAINTKERLHWTKPFYNWTKTVRCIDWGRQRNLPTTYDLDELRFCPLPHSNNPPPPLLITNPFSRTTGFITHSSSSSRVAVVVHFIIFQEPTIITETKCLGTRPETWQIKAFSDFLNSFKIFPTSNILQSAQRILKHTFPRNSPTQLSAPLTCAKL